MDGGDEAERRNRMRGLRVVRWVSLADMAVGVVLLGLGGLMLEMPVLAWIGAGLFLAGGAGVLVARTLLRRLARPDGTVERRR